MSDPSSPPAASPPRPAAEKPAPEGAVHDHVEGFRADTSGEEAIDRRLAAIEMAGEDVAAGWKPAPHQPLAPEVRYLHISRTIHQLVTDRNRSVGIFLAVASLLFAASSALLNARPEVVPIIPLKAIQYWCLPVTFGTLAVLAVFISLLLIRARIGLIFEVTKMNALVGLPSKRVERINPLSIFYLMHLLVVMLGGASAGFTAGMLASAQGDGTAGAIGTGTVVAVAFIALFQALYYLTILRATTAAKLESARG
jgi:hypothetical protein